MSRRQFVPAFAAVALLLTGCAAAESAQPPPPSVEPSPSASPTPSTTPAAHVAPEPILDLSCDDLATEQSLSAVLANEVEPVDEPHSSLGAGAGPLASAPIQSGGLNCYWSNDEPPSDEMGAPRAEHSSVHVVLLPHVSEEDLQGLGPSDTCSDPENGISRCVLEEVVSGHWVNVRAAGVRGEDPRSAVAPLFDAVKQSIAGAVTRPLAWQPPADTIPLSTDCTGFLEDAEVTGIFGVETPIVVGRTGGGWSLEAASWARLDAMPCQLLFEGSDSGVGFFTRLPGGDWAYPSDDPDAEVVQVDGLEDDDRLTVSCGPTPAGQSCSADLAVGHNWVRVTTYESEEGAPSGQAYTIAPRDSAIALAEAILANLRG